MADADAGRLSATASAFCRRSYSLDMVREALDAWASIAAAAEEHEAQSKAMLAGARDGQLRPALRERQTFLSLQNRRRASEVAVAAGKVVAVESGASCARRQGRRPKLLISGGTLTAGSKDAHAHVWKMGQLLTSRWICAARAASRLSASYPEAGRDSAPRRVAAGARLQ